MFRFRSNMLVYAGALCYYLALPPVNCWPLAFTVPVFWGYVIQRDIPVPRSLFLSRFFSVYFSAVIFWLASLWWICYPHPATSLGWLAMSMFLPLYWVLFFVSANNAVRRWNIPLWMAMPVCWVGCEYLRCRLFSGFSFCALEHSFYKTPVLIQLAQYGGQYLVSGALFCIGGIVWTRKEQDMQRSGISRCIAKAVILAAMAAAYVCFITFNNNSQENRPAMKAVAMQGNIPISLNSNADVFDKTFRQFVDLTYQYITDHRQQPPDFIVFPETVCPIPLFEFTGTIKPADIEMTDEEVTAGRQQLQNFVNQINVPVLIGLSTFRFKDSPEPARLNSALLLTPQNQEHGGSCQRYDKIHLVMFGEYLPFAEYLPDNFFIKTLCQEAARGTTAAAMDLTARSENIRIVPNICFESSVPHLIRLPNDRMLRVLVNLSNDAWFHQSCQIDQHLATHVFRAVENNCWYITATNGGFSAIISPSGKIVSCGKRGTAEAVEGWVTGADSNTVYRQFGDGYALVCAVLTAAVGLKLFLFSFCKKRNKKEKN